MKYSIIIPIYNSPVIGLVLRALEKQSYTDFETIIVGVDSSNQIEMFSQVLFDRTERKYSPAEARNRGAQRAQGKYIVFLDSDCIPAPDWLQEIDAWFGKTSADVIGGGVKISSNNYWTLADNFTMFYEYLDTLPASPRIQLPSLNLAMKKEIFEAAQGFDTNYPFPAGEDFDLTYRIHQKGFQSLFVPNAVVWHCPPRNSLRLLIRHGYYQGLYSTKLRPEYKGISFPRFLQNMWILRIFSPFMAGFATVRVFAKRTSWRYLHTLPAVFLSKLAWCFGAANSPFLSHSR